MGTDDSNMGDRTINLLYAMHKFYYHNQLITHPVWIYWLWNNIIKYFAYMHENKNHGNILRITGRPCEVKTVLRARYTIKYKLEIQCHLPGGLPFDRNWWVAAGYLPQLLPSYFSTWRTVGIIYYSAIHRLLLPVSFASEMNICEQWDVIIFLFAVPQKDKLKRNYGRQIKISGIQKHVRQ